MRGIVRGMAIIIRAKKIIKGAIFDISSLSIVFILFSVALIYEISFFKK